MWRKSLAFNALITLLTLLVIVGAFQSFQRQRDSFERLDFTYHWDKGIVVVDHVEEASAASRAGIRDGDQIWLVSGTPPGDLEGFRKTLRRIGEASLLVARGDDTFTILYQAPDVAIDYHYLFLTFIGFLYLVIGLFTFFRAARRESNLFYFVTLLAFIVFVYSPAGKTNSTFKMLYMAEEVARILLPPLMLHFFLRFPRPLFNRKWSLAAIYGPPALLGLWVASVYLFGNAIPIFGPRLSLQIIDRWEMLHFAVYFSLAFVALTYTFHTAPAEGQKKQIKWIYLGMGAGFLPFLVLYLIPFIQEGKNSPYTTIAILPLAFIPLAFAVSILKYKLWDVEVVIKEVLAYTVTFGFGMVAFSSVNLLVTRMLDEHLSLERNFIAFASGLLIAGVIVPMKGRIELLLEMVLYRDTYRHRRAMETIAEELTTYHDLDELIETIRDRASAAIRIRKMNVFVRDGGRLIAFSDESQLPESLDVGEIEHFPEDRPTVLDAPRLPDPSDIASGLLRAGYRYLFPLRYRNELQGILICTTKRNDEPLSTDDLRLVGSLTPPLALAIENARLYGRLRRQLDQIRSLKEYNENIIESSSSAIVVADAEGTILTANQAFWNLLGVPAGANLSLGELFEPYAELARSGRPSAEIRFVNQAGEEKQITVTQSPFNAPDAPRGAKVLVLGDVSEIARLERQLQEKDRLASLGLLAAGVAHEVNTPLTGISSYAQLLLADTPTDDPRYAILKKMERQTFRASRLVNNLLDFAANRSRNVEPVDLADMIRATVSIHEDMVAEKLVHVHLPATMPALVVSGDPHELQQVVTNLLLNARDAVERGGNVWIDLCEDDGDAVVTVRDDGHGIPAEIRDRLFQPLVTTKSARGGTGLGLAISQRIVENYGGEINVESVPGGGATFRVRLPLKVQSGAPSAPGAAK